MDDASLGRQLVARKILTATVVSEALRGVQASRVAGRPVDLARWLVRRGLVSAEAIEAVRGTDAPVDESLAPTLEQPPPAPVTTGRRRRPAPGPPPEPATGFGRFLDARELARGGMGVILEAVDPDLGRAIAIKVLPPDDRAGAEGVRRFLREARITGQLEHPNIVPIHELGRTPDGLAYFSMKLVRGRSMEDVLLGLRRVRSTEELLAARRKLLGDFLRVCEAVAYAHSRGVIHRDLKPANIMLGEFGEVLVMDWGIARVLRGGAADRADESGDRVAPEAGAALVTLDGSIMGTPAYMPPEQAAGDVEAIDARSDVYSLGAVLYHVLTLAAPFGGRDVTQLLREIQDGDFVPPGERAPDAKIPRELEAVVMKAMSRRPVRRYPRVEDLRADVEAWLGGQTLGAVRYSSWQRLAKWVARNRAVAALVAVASLAVVVVVAVFVGGVVRERRALEAQRRELERDKATALATEETKTAAARRLAAVQETLAPIDPIVTRGHLEFVAGVAGALDAAVREYPEYPRGHYLLALARERRLDLAGAGEEYEEVLRLANEEVADQRLADLARYRLALLAAATDPERAAPAEMAERLAAIDAARSPGPYHALAAAEAFLRAGDLAGERRDEARALLESARGACDAGLRLADDFAELHYWNAVLLAREPVLGLHRIEPRLSVQAIGGPDPPGENDRHWKKAEEALRRCLSLEPGHDRALLSLALVQLMRGRSHEGLGQIAALGASGVPSPLVALALAYAGMYAGDLDSVAATLQQARVDFPDRWEFSSLATPILCFVGRHEEAVRVSTACRQALEASPPDEGLYRTLILEWLMLSSRVDSLIELGRREEAAADWDRFVERLQVFVKRQGALEPLLGPIFELPPVLRPFVQQAPPLLTPPALRRPAAELDALAGQVAFFQSKVGIDLGRIGKGLFGDFEDMSFEILSFLLFTHQTFGRIDTTKLREQGLLGASVIQPGLACDALYLVTVPYVARLVLEGRVQLADCEALDRLASTLFLLGDVDRALAVNERQLGRYADQGAVHLERALMLAAKGAEPGEVADRLRTARALGHPLAPHAATRLLDRYRERPEIANLLR